MDMNFKLPSYVDLTPDGRIVRRAEIGEDGYYENETYILQLEHSTDGIFVNYYGDDDNFLEAEQVREAILEHNLDIAEL